jgi:TPR repeat protein
MANREDLAIIRAARAGQAQAQLTLGQRYLFGGNGLPQSLATAFHWLERAARQDVADAWMLIAQHIPYEIVLPLARPQDAALWYERAFDAGLKKAGLVFARLVLGNAALLTAELRKKAVRALEVVAKDGNADAQWLLAQQVQGSAAAPAANQVAPVAATRSDAPYVKKASPDSSATSSFSAIESPESQAQQWTQKAADAGIEQARHALAEMAWEKEDRTAFLKSAAPLADNLLEQYEPLIAQLNGPSDMLARNLGGQNTVLLVRLAQVLQEQEQEKADLLKAQQLLELAACADDRGAQLALGLLYARMDPHGERIFAGQGSANYKKAIRWLTLAGERGMAAAWFALSRIYLKPEFSQRNLTDVQHYLERAAEMGHVEAQLECGMSAWRNRRDDPANDVRAVYWLQKAATHGNVEAQTLLGKIADRPGPAAWAVNAKQQLTREMINAHPFLAARIELAIMFGLSRPEALLIDLKQADCGHCLLVDIRTQYARSKRRLILIETGEERAALNRVGRLFEDVDCGQTGPEGNYRQRLYRLRTVLPAAAADELSSIQEGASQDEETPV